MAYGHTPYMVVIPQPPPTHTWLDGRDVIGLYLEQQQQLTSGLIIYLPTFYLLTYLLISDLLIY